MVRAALQPERVGIPRFVLATRMLERAVSTLKRTGRMDSSTPLRAARARAACELAKLYSYQIIDQRQHGRATGPEASAVRK